MDDASKLCTHCKMLKPLDHFRKRSNYRLARSLPAAHQNLCKRCERVYLNGTKQQKWVKRASLLRRHRGGDITGSQLRLILGEPDTCYICGLPVQWEGSELDHVHPLSKGGVTTISNIKWTHRQCNRMKHDLSIPELKELLTRILNNLNST